MSESPARPEETDPVLTGVSVAVGSAAVTMAASALLARGPLAAFRDAGGAKLDVPLATALEWAFYAAHGVPLRVQTDGRWTLVTHAVDSPVLYAVPPATLVVGGYLVARLADVDDLRAGARAGAAVAVGYAALAVGGLLVTRYGVDSSFATVSVHPDAARAVLAGVLYPVAFGGAGGTLAAAATDRLPTPRRRRLERAGVVLLVALLAALLVGAAVR
ncbi:MAG: hypothetical protein ABEJ23_06725 [Haloarculaceae archaeon]